MSKEELKPINCDMDAQRWAKEFMSSKFAANLPPEVDEGLMLSWFANAIMCGWDNAHWKLQASQAALGDGEKRFYGKICHEEGVVAEREFKTVAEANAYVNGFHDTLESLDSDDDSLFATIGNDPAMEAP